MISNSRAAILLFATVLVTAGYTSSARADCNPAMPADDDDVECDDVTPSTGFDGSAATGLTITTSGSAMLDESDGAFNSAILVSDDNDITIGMDAIITVTTANGFGINAGDNNTITNQGTIDLDMVDGATAINAGDGNTIDNQGTITVNGDNGSAIESGDNTRVVTSGTIDLIGNFTRGISAANRSDPQLASDISNSGTLNVDGTDSIGISVGDGWIRGPIVGEAVDADPGVINSSTGTINVSGDRSVGIFAGDLSNTANTNNSFVSNEGTINVTGIDAIGISVGGNDLFTPFDFQGTTPLDVTNVLNRDMIIGGQNAGPLIVIREFVAGSENRVINSASGQILADLMDRTLADRGVAIRGTVGTEFVFNFGEIRGDIELLDGDDRYVHAQGAILTDPNLGPSVFGGLGNDVAVLVANSVAADTFDLRALDGFETVEVGGGSFGWELANGGTFTGTVEITDNGLLRVDTPVTFGGDFLASPTGTLELTLDGTMTPLIVSGTSVFDGALVLNLGPSVAPASPPLLAISTIGPSSGQFDFDLNQGLTIFDLTYDAAGLTIQLLTSGNAVGVAVGSTQRAIAKHLDDIKAVGSPSPGLQTLLDEFDTASGRLNNVFRAFSPEIYDAQTQAIVDGGRRVTNLLFNRPRECVMGERVPWQKADAQLPCHARSWSPWLASVGGIRSREKSGDHLSYDAQLAGLVFGIDVRPMDDLDLTIAIASQRGTVSGDARGASTITLTDLMGQVAWNRGALRVQGALGWGHGFHQDRRRIRFSEAGLTSISTRGLDDHDSDRITLGTEIGYLFDVGPIKIEPIGGLDWTWVYQRPIHEDESFGFGIRIDSREDSVGSLNAGIRVSTSYLHSRYLGQWFLWMDGVWQPSIDVRWRQVLTGWEREIDARLQGAPSGVPDFTIKGREDRGGAEIAAAVSFTPKNANRLQFDLRYEAFVSSHTVSHDLIGAVRIGF